MPELATFSSDDTDTMDSNTIPANAKITICCKRTQDKKTAQCIHLIRHRIEEESAQIHAIFARVTTPKPSIHIIFTMNTLLNNKQFSSRLAEIAELCGGTSKIVEFSSRKSGQYNHVSTAAELKALLLDPRECPRIIICCSNTMRFTDGETLMGDVDRIRGNEVRQFAYYDEMHKYIDQCRDKIKALCSLNSVKGILGLTATPQPIFIRSDPFWSKLFFMEVDDLSGPNYCALKNHVYVVADSDPDAANAEQRTIKYVRDTLAAHPSILDDGTYSFIPGVNVRRSHTAVRDAVWAVNPNAVVVILNINKTMQYLKADGTPASLPIEVDKEVGDTIATMMADPRNNLAGRPLVVTGFICIGMGQSLVCPALGTFSSAVLSHEDMLNEDLYQLLGRTAAVSMDWPTFRRTTVYCPESTMHRCIAMERVAYSMQEDATRPDCLTLDDLARAAGDDEAGQAALAHIRVKKAKTPKREGHLGGPGAGGPRLVDASAFRLYTSEAEFKAALAAFHPEYKFRNRSHNAEKPEFLEAACGGKAAITDLHTAAQKVHLLTGGKGATATSTVWLPTYADRTNAASLHYMVIVPKEMTAAAKAAADAKCPSVPYVPRV